MEINAQAQSYEMDRGCPRRSVCRRWEFAPTSNALNPRAREFLCESGDSFLM